VIQRLLSWCFDWDSSLPLHHIWSDADTRFGTRLMWRQRISGWFVCPRKGHDWYADMCGRPEHDRCARCDARRDQQL
jgi:hypothetical protein